MGAGHLRRILYIGFALSCYSSTVSATGLARSNAVVANQAQQIEHPSRALNKSVIQQKQAAALAAALKRISDLELRPSPSAADLSAAYSAIAILLSSLDRTSEAEAYLKKSVAVFEGYDARGNEMDAVPIMATLARLYVGQRRYAEAVEILRRAQLITHRTSGVYNLDQLAIVDRISQVHLLAGDGYAADLQQKFHYHVNRGHYGADHPSMLPVMSKLAGWYRNTGQFNAAITLYESAMALSIKSRGQAHADQIQILRDIASVYYLRGECCADKMLGQVLEIIDTHPGWDYAESSSARVQLADMQTVLKRDKKAARSYQAVWQGLSEDQAAQMFAEPRLLGITRWDNMVTAFQKAYRRLSLEAKKNTWHSVRQTLAPIEDLQQSLQQENYPVELIGNPIPVCFPQLLDLLAENTTDDLGAFSLDLDFNVDRSGAVSEIRVLDKNAPNTLSEFALNVFRLMRFRPRLVNGEPVATAHVKMHQNFEPYRPERSGHALPFSSMAAHQGCQMLVVDHY